VIKMTNNQTNIEDYLQELELVFALPDHKIRYPKRRPVITNFRPDYFGSDEYEKFITKAQIVETRLGTYSKKYDFSIASRNVKTVISGSDESMIPSVAARVVIYERK